MGEAAPPFVARACPACGRAEHRLLFSVPAERFCGANATYRAAWPEILGVAPATAFPIVACRRCGFAFAGLLPPERFLEDLYEQVIDPERALAVSEGRGWVAHQLGLGVRLLEELAREFGDDAPCRVLDYGCGHGSLVRALGGSSLECLGLETSRRRLELLGSRGLPAVAGSAEALRLGPYHAVVLSDVLEHVPEPRETLALCRELLSPRGLLLVSVPDFGGGRLAAPGADRGAAGDRELNPWEHLNYFSPASLRAMLRDAAFAEVRGEGTIDVGLRSGLSGVRRWGNGAKSAIRIARHLLGRGAETTCLCAQVVEGDPSGPSRPRRAGSGAS